MEPYSYTELVAWVRAIPGSQIARAVTGDLVVVFDNEYGDAVDIEGTRPEVTCITEDAERYGLTKKGASLTVAGKRYRIRRHEPDGTGLSRLILEG